MNLVVRLNRANHSLGVQMKGFLSQVEITINTNDREC